MTDLTVGIVENITDTQSLADGSFPLCFNSTGEPIINQLSDYVEIKCNHTGKQHTFLVCYLQDRGEGLGHEKGRCLWDLRHLS